MIVNTAFDIFLVILAASLALIIVGAVLFLGWKLWTYLSDEMRERRKIKEELDSLAMDLRILVVQDMAKYAHYSFVYTDSEKEKIEKDILDRLEHSDRVKHY